MSFSRRRLLIAVCLFAVIAIANSKSKPKPASTYFNICKRGDQEQLNVCVKNVIKDLKISLAKGIPALGVVSNEPLVIPRMAVQEGSGSFTYSTTLTNFTLHGLGTYDVKSAKVHLDDEKFVLDYHTVSPKVISTAEYEMGGKIIIIPIQGVGNCEFNFTDFSMVLHTEGKIVPRDDKQYINLTSIKVDLSYDYKQSRFWLFNLFNGDKRLGDATNNALNENGEEAFYALKQLFEAGFAEVLLDQFSKVFNAYSIDEIFPK